MIRLFKDIDDINTRMQEFQKVNHVKDYRVVLGVLNNIVVYIKGIGKVGVLEGLEKEFPKAAFVDVTDDDDMGYSFFFENDEVVQIRDSRIRLSNLLEAPTKSPSKKVPVVTFFSYKGGVGRSTTLAAFAAHLAINEGLKVVLMDCDFEAPGLTNFFMEDPENVSYKNGLVEYFMDSETDDNIPLSNYYWEASKKFSGKGSIFVFHAGNLSTEYKGGLFPNDMSHYLNGLTRLDIFSKDSLYEKFSSLFKRVNDTIKPDIILMDSRTGFNDVFGVIAFRLSHAVLGFFGSDAQSRPGIDYFLSLKKNENAPALLMVHSIIPAEWKTKLHKVFCENANDRLMEIFEEGASQDVDVPSIEIFPISENSVLRNIGKPTESYEEFINLIKEQDFSDYRNLFGRLFEFCKDSVDYNKLSPIEIQEKERELKSIILNKTKDNMPQPYAETITDFSKELKSGHFYSRNCMLDLFNPEKFLIIGAKGTGKSYIYKSLGDKDIVSSLQKKAKREDGEYLFVQVINENHAFETSKLDEVLPADLFYDRFWIIYIWNVVMAKEPYGYNTLLPLHNIENSAETAEYFKSSINDTQFVIEIEKDLKKLDDYLSSMDKEKHVVILFDELDNIVKPNLWSERVAPLINLCKNRTYENVHLKIFVRDDLFERMGNINNKIELRNRSIDIEWSREELFSYFFKIVLSHTKKDFYNLMRLYKDYPNELIENIIAKLEDKSVDQPPMEDKLLEILSTTFFGKYAYSQNGINYGLSYDWFFNNLKNANETLSIRPFIDMVTFAINLSLENGVDSDSKPILPSKYYANAKTRRYAVKRHIIDLSSENGNLDLSTVLNFIQNKADSQYKMRTLLQEDFYTLMKMIIKKERLIELKEVEELVRLLLVDGVVSQIPKRLEGGEVKSAFQFALLYKYYLGLKG
jgi:hypothetical protein